MPWMRQLGHSKLLSFDNVLKQMLVFRGVLFLVIA